MAQDCDNCKSWDGRARVTLRNLITGERYTVIGCSNPTAARDSFVAGGECQCRHFTPKNKEGKCSST